MSPSATPTILSPDLRPNLAGTLNVEVGSDASHSSEEWYVIPTTPLESYTHSDYPGTRASGISLTTAASGTVRTPNTDFSVLLSFIIADKQWTANARNMGDEPGKTTVWDQDSSKRPKNPGALGTFARVRTSSPLTSSLTAHDNAAKCSPNEPWY